jgi:glycosyltransferase involved in cell wall biosynthesis
MTLRPGLLTYGLDRAPTGVGRTSLELISSLRQLGLPVTLLGQPAPTLPGHADYPRLPLPGCRLLPGLLTLGNFVIPSAARRAHLDLVHDPSGSAPFLFGAGGAKTVVTVYDMFAAAFPGTSTPLETLVTRLWLPLVLPRVDAVVTCSEHSKKDILRFTHAAPEKIHIVPSGQRGFAPLDRATAAAQVARFGLEPGYILSLTSFDPRRNLPRLLEAYAILRRLGERRPLVLAGKSRLLADPLSETIAELGLEQFIIRPGYLPWEDLPALYSAADVFVFPSLYEGFGMPPLEALACGAPVACANATSLPEVVGDAALLFDPLSVESIALALRRILADAPLRAELRQKGLERAAQFTWENSARRLLEVYKQVL